MFPVFCSLLSADAVAALVSAQYQLDIASCQFWHRGNSDVYLLETAGLSQYFLKIYHYRQRNRENIGFELQLLSHLKDKGIPVSHPICTVAGNDTLEIEAPEGLRYASLFIRAPGNVAIGDLNPQQGYILGSTLARLHQSGQDFQSSYLRPPLDPRSILENSVSEIIPFLGDLRVDLHSIYHELLRQIPDLLEEAPYWTVCWGDPHSGNVHFSEDQSPTLFDFDQCGYGYRLFDIAKFWQVSLQSGLSSSIRSAFLSGYQSQQLLGNLEISSLNCFTRIAHIWSWSISLNIAKFHDACRLDSSFFIRKLQHLKRIADKELYPKISRQQRTAY